MFTTAGDTFLTSGAKLWPCISAIGEVIVSGAAGVAWDGLFMVGGFSAQTKGESAKVAPSPKPSAAARPLPSHGWRVLQSVTSANCSSCRAGACLSGELARRRDRRLSRALIRCNLAGIGPCRPEPVTQPPPKEGIMRDLYLGELGWYDRDIESITTEISLGFYPT